MAFRKIDIEGLGYITKEQFTTLMMQEGEPFTEEEMEETITIAVDPTTQTVPYEYYINQIMVNIFFHRKSRITSCFYCGSLHYSDFTVNLGLTYIKIKLKLNETVLYVQ